MWEVRHHGADPGIETFCQAVETSARSTLDGRRLRGMEFDWDRIEQYPARYITPTRFQEEPQLVTKLPDYTREESDRARILALPDNRQFLLRLAQVGKLRSVDAASGAGEEITQALLEAGLVRTEYLVVCRQDSHTICSVAERADVMSAAGSQLRCSICGRPFRDELVQEILALTEEGNSLLTSSRWMMIWITELLVQSGLSLQNIAWNAAAGEDELDIMMDAPGMRVFFELKDREFGLGDAYPFAYRVARYGGTFGVVVSTKRVAEEAKKFFREQRQSTEAGSVLIEMVEGSKPIEAQVVRLVDQLSRVAVNGLLFQLEPLAVNLVPVLQAWMSNKSPN